MKPLPFLSFCCASLLATGCATQNPDEGRYLQVYRSGILIMEMDFITNYGCRTYKASAMKGTGIAPDASVICAATSVGESLPVLATFGDSTLKARMLLLENCQTIAAESLKTDPKSTVTCELAKKN